ncbi:MAG: type II toxin-antitoxin system prevent-host-death family antitoxin [Actinomycetota bacterium]|nr:type II toxin-antitoxin system prevent-host-death family antitoxin [Actinomycetota bacterium]
MEGDDLAARSDAIIIANRGEPAAVLVSTTEWAALQKTLAGLRETLAVVQDPLTVTDLREAQASTDDRSHTDDVIARFHARWS